MNKLLLPIVVAVLVLSSCGKPDNPLVTASDGQFLEWMAPRNAFSPPCAAAFYEPDWFIKQYNGLKFSPRDKISAVSEQQKDACVSDLLQRANQVGIKGNVTREDLLDARVRQRYLANRKR